MKLCLKCHIEKDEVDFRVIKKTGKLFSYCNSCKKEYDTKRLRNLGVKELVRRIEPTPLPIEKVCTRCKVLKSAKEYRIRTEKRIYRYLEPACKMCEIELRVERYKEQRKSPEGRAKHNELAKKYHKRHREKCLIKMKEYKQRVDFKKYMKEWYAKPENKLRTYDLSKKRNRVYVKKLVDTLSDKYLINMISHPRDGFMTRDEVRKNPEIIELFRNHIKLKRLINDKHSNRQHEIITQRFNLCI